MPKKERKLGGAYTWTRVVVAGAGAKEGRRYNGKN